MTTGQALDIRKAIILAVCNGAHNMRQIAARLKLPHSTINNYFYPGIRPVAKPFINGDLLQWTPGKDNTLRPGPNLLRVWRGGQVVDVYSGVKPIKNCQGTCNKPCISANEENPFHWCGNCPPF